ncbi:MAG: ABC transporter ATP-binding protein [Tissierellia bacterium]|nr:ABC transporter ATP-binding protein [Tissierellia bacterium]
MTYGKLDNISVSYEKGKNILQELSLDIHEGELLSLLGPSGCGKSTTLRAIAGFVPISSGNFYLENKDMTNVAIHKRDFGLVFQSYALFPHLTVYENVAFGLKMRKMKKKEIEKKVYRMLEICNLTELRDRFPENMSGGQRQRVALARALVIEPKLLLLDEPLSNLDAQLRYQMRSEIRRIQQELNMTTIFVTHDQEECFAISDRVAIMNKGIIEQLDKPEEIYSNPKNEYIARFVGFENFVDARVFDDNKEGLATFRSKDIDILEDGRYKGKVTSIEFLGEKYKILVTTDMGTLTISTNKKVAINEEIRFNIHEQAIKFLGGN